MTHPRAQAFLDAYNLDVTTVDVDPIIDAENHRVVVVNFVDKSWVFDFAHASDHDFVDVHLFDDTSGVEKFHVDTADQEWNPDGPSTPIGVFAMGGGLRRGLDDSEGEMPTNHGWAGGSTITLLADHPEAA